MSTQAVDVTNQASAVVKEDQAKLCAEDSSARTTRARRFGLQLRVRYRVRGERTWRRGETENISSSGLLFRGEIFAEINTPLELCLTMPPVKSEGAAEMICRGTIVRSMRAVERHDLSTLAVRILHSRLVRP